MARIVRTEVYVGCKLKTNRLHCSCDTVTSLIGISCTMRSQQQPSRKVSRSTWIFSSAAPSGWALITLFSTAGVAQDAMQKQAGSASGCRSSALGGATYRDEGRVRSLGWWMKHTPRFHLQYLNHHFGCASSGSGFAYISLTHAFSNRLKDKCIICL